MGRWAWVAALGVLAMVGCGGGHGAPANCLQVQPCGGDVVGTWSFAGTCSNLAAQNEQLRATCPGASVNGVSVALTGLLTFGADGTYTATNWHETFAGTQTAPLSCINSSTCTESNGTSTDSSDGATVTITTSCSGTSTCVCRVSGTLDVTAGSGTYATASSVVTLTGGPAASTFPYCVEGDRLHLMQTRTTASTNPPTETTTVLSDIVAERQ